MESVVELLFINPDAVDKKIRFMCDESAVEQITDWYEAFYEGDAYTIYVDGKEVG